jgi:hypothetical protein
MGLLQTADPPRQVNTLKFKRFVKGNSEGLNPFRDDMLVVNIYGPYCVPYGTRLFDAHVSYQYLFPNGKERQMLFLNLTALPDGVNPLKIKTCHRQT